MRVRLSKMATYPVALPLRSTSLVGLARLLRCASEYAFRRRMTTTSHAYVSQTSWLPVPLNYRTPLLGVSVFQACVYTRISSIE
jgi:hypothetical protein